MTTVSVYNKTSRWLPLNSGENVLEIGSHFFPAVPAQVLSLLVSHFSSVADNGRKLSKLLLHVSASKDRWIPGIPGAEGGTEDSRPPSSEFFINTLLVCQLGHSISAMLGPPAAASWPRSKSVTGRWYKRVWGVQYMDEQMFNILQINWVSSSLLTKPAAVCTWAVSWTGFFLVKFT